MDNGGEEFNDDEDTGGGGDDVGGDAPLILPVGGDKDRKCVGDDDAAVDANNAKRGEWECIDNVLRKREEAGDNCANADATDE
jgi:hypothetical protein